MKLSNRTTVLLTALALTGAAVALPLQQPHAAREGTASAHAALGHVTELHSLSLEGGRIALDAAVAEARRLGVGGAIAIVDASGELVCLARLDGTFGAAATVSTGKARTAVRFHKPTRAFEEAINGGRTALAGMPDFTPLQGGVPIVVDGHVVGGIGVSGASSAAQDEELALAGAHAFEAAL